MDVRTEELIAIGASITANCKPCLKYHVARAKENGAREQEIARAIEMGMMVRKGAASQMDELVSTLSADIGAGEKAPGSTCG
ncbi:MAG: carboxymuconolactone decarboxylase family protein [Planctomycetota bacterium]|jgi:AhpD family alkylhydroperoxidase